MKVLGVIPARYGSQRFPGKPLAMIAKKPMIQWVYERTQKTGKLHHLVVATDDKRIQQAVEKFGGHCVMTQKKHRSGTERCGEVIEKADTDFDVVINIQGDEPFIREEQVELLINCFNDKTVQIATLLKPVADVRALTDPNTMKVVVRQDGRALYFSRATIPYIRDTDEHRWLEAHTFFKHIGIYGYRSDVLRKLVKLHPTPLEQAESLEQLRWMEHGYPIHTVKTTLDSHAVDTPEDLEFYEQHLKHYI